MKKVMLTEKLYDIKNGEVYKGHIRKGCDFTVALITENGETTAYYSADLIESAEEWEEGNINLEVVGDDFQIIKEDKKIKKMKKMKLGLCEGRHPIEGIEGYVFTSTLNPTDISYMSQVCHERLEFCNGLDLYVTGLTVALVTVINYCCQNYIPLTLWHFDRDTGDYYPQKVATRVDFDLLQEAGYY